MKTFTTTLTPMAASRSALRALALGAALGTAALLAVPAHAAPGDVRSTTVSFADINTQNPAGARAFYGRLRAAARQVCDDSNARGVEAHRSVKQCRKAALDRAVTQAAQPLLTALHRKGLRALG